MIKKIIKQFDLYWRAKKFADKWDPSEIAYLKKNLKCGEVAIDIGAHKGGYLYWMRKLVGKDGKVFCFEPQINLFNYLKSIQKSYNWSNVIIENAGIGNKNKTISLKVPGFKGETSPGATFSLNNDLDGEPIYQYPVSVVPLDEYIKNKDINSVAFIKIDVEGFEKEVLLGAIEILSKYKPDVLMECEQRHNSKESIFIIFDVLLSMGYKGYFFLEKKIKPLNQFSLETHQKRIGEKFWDKPDYCNNFLFVDERKTEEKILEIGSSRG